MSCAANWRSAMRSILLSSRLDAQLAATSNLQHLSNQSDFATRKTLQPTLDQAYTQDIELAIQQANAIQDVIAFTPNREHLALQGLQSRAALIVTSRAVERLKVAAAALQELTGQFADIQVPPARPAAILQFLQTRKGLSQKIVQELDRIDRIFLVMNEWQQPINLAALGGRLCASKAEARADRATDRRGPAKYAHAGGRGSR